MVVPSPVPAARSGGLQSTWLTARKLLLAARDGVGAEDRRGRKAAAAPSWAHASPQGPNGVPTGTTGLAVSAAPGARPLPPRSGFAAQGRCVPGAPLASVRVGGCGAGGCGVWGVGWLGGGTIVVVHCCVCARARAFVRVLRSAPHVLSRLWQVSQAPPLPRAPLPHGTLPPLPPPLAASGPGAAPRVVSLAAPAPAARKASNTTVASSAGAARGSSLLDTADVDLEGLDLDGIGSDLDAELDSDGGDGDGSHAGDDEYGEGALFLSTVVVVRVGGCTRGCKRGC